MKRLVEEEVVVKKATIVETTENAMTQYLGQYVYIMCLSYAYSGTVTGVNSESLELSDAEIVYDTGAWSNKKWTTAEKLPTGGKPQTLLYCNIETIIPIVR